MVVLNCTIIKVHIELFFDTGPGTLYHLIPGQTSVTANILSQTCSWSTMDCAGMCHQHKDCVGFVVEDGCHGNHKLCTLTSCRHTKVASGAKPHLYLTCK